MTNIAHNNVAQNSNVALVEFHDAHVASRDNAIEAFATLLQNAIAERREYERNKCEDNLSIQSKLAGYAKSVAHKDVAAIMFASNCDANRINRSERVGSRYNEKAYEKDINIARTIAASDSLNHYTLHVLRTAYNLHKAGIALTHETAFAACMKGSKVKDSKLNKYIDRYERIEVSKGTASTQSSSSINAMQGFDILKEGRNAQGEVAYILNVESKATQKLLSLYCEAK